MVLFIYHQMYDTLQHNYYKKCAIINTAHATLSGYLRYRSLKPTEKTKSLSCYTIHMWINLLQHFSLHFIAQFTVSNLFIKPTNSFALTRPFAPGNKLRECSLDFYNKLE